MLTSSEPTTTLMPEWFAEEFDLGGLASRWPKTAMQTDDPRIGIAKSADELYAISRLRYDLYVARDGKQYDRARHISRTFMEPIDRLSLNFFARSEKGIVGGVRLVRATDALKDPHLSLLVEAAQPNDLDTAVVNSRFALLPEMGARSLIEPMFQQIYRSGFIAGACEYLIATRADLSQLFFRFGFQPTGKSYSDPAIGKMTVLIFNAFDLSHRRFAQRYIDQIEASSRAHTANTEDAA